MVKVCFWVLVRASFSYPSSKLKLYYQNIRTFLPWFCFLQIPVFQRGGTVLPLKTTAGKSTEWMTDISYELHVALDTEVLGDDIPLTKLSFTLSDLFRSLLPIQPTQWYLHLYAQWLSSTPPIWGGLPPSSYCPLKVRLSLVEAEHFSDLSQPSSSPLEEGAENEHTTNFLWGTERELPTTVCSHKWGDTWQPHQFTKPGCPSPQALWELDSLSLLGLQVAKEK